MNTINVGNWQFDGDCWTRGKYVVTKDGQGFRAWMPVCGKMVTIGTSCTPNVPQFLNKIDGYIELKEGIYAQRD